MNRGHLGMLATIFALASVTVVGSNSRVAQALVPRPYVSFDMRPALFHLVSGRWIRTVRVAPGERVRFQLLYSATVPASQPWHSVSAMLLVQRPQHPHATAPAVWHSSMNEVRTASGRIRFRVTTHIPSQWSGKWIGDFLVTGRPGHGAVGRFLPFTVVDGSDGSAPPPSQLGLTLGTPLAPARLTQDQAVALARDYDAEVESHPFTAQYGSLDVEKAELSGLIDVWEVTVSDLDLPAPGPRGRPHPVFHRLTIVVDDQGMKVLFATAY